MEAKGTLGDRVTVDIRLDDSGFRDGDERLRLDVSGRVWKASAGLLPFALPESRFLVGSKTGLGFLVAGKGPQWEVAGFAGRPEGRPHRNQFAGRGAVQEYVLTDRSGAPNPIVVVGTDRVTLDGRRLERGVDYEMDYLEGAVLLARPLLPLDERRRLVVEFEESSGGSGFRSSTVGLRGTRRFGRAASTRERNWVSLGFAAEFDDRGAEASPDTTGATPGQVVVFEAAARADLAPGLGVRAVGALSARDTDTWSDEGELPTKGAFDLGLEFSRGNLGMKVSRFVAEPGFQGVGLDRFEAGGEGRVAAKDAAVSTAELLYKAGKAATLRARFRDAVTNLDQVRAEAEEHLQAASVDLDLHKLHGADVALRYLGEDATQRAAGQAEAKGGGRDRLGASATRKFGAVSVQVRGEWEGSRVPADEAGGAATGLPGPAPGETHRTAGLELTGPGDGRVAWSLGGAVRDVVGGEDVEPLRVQRDLRAGMSSTLGSGLTVRTDLHHLKEERLDPDDTTGPPVQETNTGEARVRWNRGTKVEVESHLSAEVRSRILADPSDARFDPLRGGTAPGTGRTWVPQTVVTAHPVLARGATHRLTLRPVDPVQVTGNLRLQTESDTVTGEAQVRDRSGDGRVAWEARPGLRLSLEAGAGTSVNVPSKVDRSSGHRRLEVVKSFDDGSSLELTRQVDLSRDRREPARDRWVEKDRLGMERRLGRGLTAKAGLFEESEDSAVRTDRQGFDLGVVWERPQRGQKLELGFELGQLLGVDTRGEDVDSARRRWSVNASSRIGTEGFLDMGLALSSTGEDGKGGTGYQAVTSRVGLGLDF